MAFSKSYDPKTWIDPNAPLEPSARPAAAPRPPGRPWLGYVLAVALLAAGGVGAYATRADPPAAARAG